MTFLYLHCSLLGGCVVIFVTGMHSGAVDNAAISSTDLIGLVDILDMDPASINPIVVAPNYDTEQYSTCDPAILYQPSAVEGALTKIESEGICEESCELELVSGMNLEEEILTAEDCDSFEIFDLVETDSTTSSSDFDSLRSISPGCVTPQSLCVYSGHSLPPVIERRLRKKMQNKTAASRYREKKRSEQDVAMNEFAELEHRNIELKARVEQINQEVIYLKSLLEELGVPH